MGRRWRLAALLACVALAGCAGVLGGSPAETTATATGTVTATVTPTETATPTATEPPVDPDNPFNKRNLTVVIDPANGDRNLTTTVRKALWYWENHSEEYAGYPVSFTVTDETRPDIHIQLAKGQFVCQQEVDPRTVGCAPINEASAPTTSYVQVSASYTTHYTREIAIHELGHALGLEHGDEPTEYMDTSRPTGYDRDHWRVYIDTSATDNQAVRGNLVATFNDLEGDSEFRYGGFSWEVANSPDSADVVVEYRPDGSECFGDRGGLCTTAAEYRDQTWIVIERVGPEQAASMLRSSLVES